MSKKNGNKRVDLNELKPKLCDDPKTCGPTECSNGELVVLSDEDVAKIKDLQTKITVLKLNLADSVLQHDAIVDDIKATHALYLAEAKALALAHGVDIDKPECGKWNLDIAAKTISKIS